MISSANGAGNGDSKAENAVPADLKVGSFSEHLYNTCSILELVHRLYSRPSEDELNRLSLNEDEWRNEILLAIRFIESD